MKMLVNDWTSKGMVSIDCLSEDMLLSDWISEEKLLFDWTISIVDGVIDVGSSV